MTVNGKITAQCTKSSRWSPKRANHGLLCPELTWNVAVSQLEQLCLVAAE